MRMRNGNCLLNFKTSKDDIDDEKAVDVKIKSFVIHANYSTKTKYNDIALLELERPLDESEFNRLLLPGCLHTENELISNLNITGWGRNNSESLSTVNWLQVASVSEVTVEDCNRSYANLRRRELLNTQLCAKGSNSADACQGKIAKYFLHLRTLCPPSLPSSN